MGKTVVLQSWFWHSSSADFEPATYCARSRPLAHSCRGLRYQLGLHCFDVAQSMMIHQPLMKRSSEAAIFLKGHFIGEKGTSYMYHSIFIVLLQHISPLTQLWTQTFIVAYETPIFKSVQSNSCFRNSCWSGVKSAQALKKGCIQLTNQSAIFLARIYQFPIWTGSNINCFYWYVYKQVDMQYK